MEVDYRLSKTERQIMEFLWTNNRPVKTDEIMEHFIAGGRQWKRQTLNTLLIRMGKKNVIDRRYRGYVAAKYSEVELLNIECRDFLVNVCDGKLSNFLKAYFAGEKISETEAAELIAVIKSVEEKTTICWK